MITMQPIGLVQSPRHAAEDDNWGTVESSITLAPELPEEMLTGMETFSHLEIIFYMHQLTPDSICQGTRHPRENPAWPKIGIYAQRGRNRPNQIGCSIVKLLNRSGRTLVVQGLDAIDGTPVLDIKPVFQEYLPREPIRQPSWVSELMEKYF